MPAVREDNAVNPHRQGRSRRWRSLREPCPCAFTALGCLLPTDKGAVCVSGVWGMWVRVPITPAPPPGRTVGELRHGHFGVPYRLDRRPCARPPRALADPPRPSRKLRFRRKRRRTERAATSRKEKIARLSRGLPENRQSDFRTPRAHLAPAGGFRSGGRVRGHPKPVPLPRPAPVGRGRADRFRKPSDGSC